MVVTIDKGMYNDLHPWDKKSVGERLALWALRMVFGEDIVCSGPIYDYMEKEGSTLRLYFKHVGSGLTIQGDRLDGLEVCGEDEIFYPAEGIIEGDTLLVACDRVQAPCHVRYGWRNNPEEANLYNKEGLPASPFTSIK
jgi:sialate O-acetylesterase